jgi:hypothetical protein
LSLASAAWTYISRGAVCNNRTNCFFLFNQTGSFWGHLNWNTMYNFMTLSADDSLYYIWATAHATMATLSLRMACYYDIQNHCGYSNINDIPWISADSIIDANLHNADSLFNCDPETTLMDVSMYAMEFAPTLYDDYDWPASRNQYNFCNITAYEERNKTAYTKYHHAEFNDFGVSTKTYEEIRISLLTFGFHYVVVPHDYKLCHNAFVPDEIYEITSNTTTLAPVIVWGVWKDANNKIFLGGTFMGRNFHTIDTMLWFPVEMAQYDSMSYMQWVLPEPYHL